MERPTDGQTDGSYFIGPFQPRPGVQKNMAHTEGVNYLETISMFFFDKIEADMLQITKKIKQELDRLTSEIFFKYDYS